MVVPCSIITITIASKIQKNDVASFDSLNDIHLPQLVLSSSIITITCRIMEIYYPRTILFLVLTGSFL